MSVRLLALLTCVVLLVGLGGRAQAHEPTRASTSGLPVGAAAPMKSMGMADDDDSGPPPPMPQRLWRWIGKWHVAVVHFPIALFLTAGLLEVLGRLTRASFAPATTVIVLLAAGFAVLAATLGWFAAGVNVSQDNVMLAPHRWIGTAIAVTSLPLAVLALLRGRADAPAAKRAYGGLLALLCVGVLVNAYFGGSMVHGGLNHMAF